MISHDKRYMVISGTWNFGGEYHGKSTYAMQPTKYWDEFDTVEEANEWIEIIKEQHKDVKKPSGIEYDKKRGYINIPAGSYNWGYVLLDFEKEELLDVGDGGIHGYSKKALSKNDFAKWEFYDTYFRKPGEVPNDYKWDDGEYRGWLQFRWGDGKNAVGSSEEYIIKDNTPPINYLLPKNRRGNQVKHSVQNKPKKSFYKPYNDDLDCESSEYDDIQDKFDANLDKETGKNMMEKYGW